MLTVFWPFVKNGLGMSTFLGKNAFSINKTPCTAKPILPGEHFFIRFPSKKRPLFYLFSFLDTYFNNFEY